MKKIIKSLVILACVCAFPLESESLKGKTSVTAGSTILDFSEETLSFGGAYIVFDSLLQNDFVSVGGKIYYRWNKSTSLDSESQKLELKKAYVKIRPFSSQIFEAALGKLYSYYLPGGYFSIAEIYTGSSRWGKTGAGVKTSISGFSGGISLPLTESYVPFVQGWGVGSGFSYDFGTISDKFKITPGVSLLYNYVVATEKSAEQSDFSGTVSVFWKPDFNSILRNFSLFAAFSWNSESYVSSAVFKNVSNYKALGNAELFSLSAKANIANVAVVFEGEGGFCAENSYIPLYAALQTTIPLLDFLSLKPTFSYYAGLNYSESELSRSTWEFYPRILFNFFSNTVSLGAKFALQQTDTKTFAFNWNIPMYWSYSFGK